MSNYLNQIESDLYKLNSITNGSGEVVEMVAEMKEKYEKAEAFDAILKAYDEAFSREHTAGEVSNIIEKYESGDYDAKK